jgi:hypothetical protein
MLVAQGVGRVWDPEEVTNHNVVPPYSVRMSSSVIIVIRCVNGCIGAVGPIAYEVPGEEPPNSQDRNSPPKWDESAVAKAKEIGNLIDFQIERIARDFGQPVTEDPVKAIVG